MFIFTRLQHIYFFTIGRNLGKHLPAFRNESLSCITIHKIKIITHGILLVKSVFPPSKHHVYSVTVVKMVHSRASK